ncbi:arabinose efflux permease family protein [Sanguibacter keddieii DSM 10542]|uniref:Arabinose efflux permease family protein n=1 Tax=Sanguibacter keddieii (strain ATCC 51767 / DSM 10542 / NCFB 3025 / ST-74) TaxID=446469 RepID=D1BE43_SANKS|nr:MFS transporter [Sanguibacter keddieii]ACZ23264.1 arabinose efflux permease family protein [Sanguibacter keddieii DSM 10542]
MTAPAPEPATYRQPEVEHRLPVLALALMALSGFIIIVTETLPAGLLPQLAEDFEVSDGTAGQLITTYALGTVVAAIPTIAMTRGAPRKPLLVVGMLGFLVSNTLTALAPTLALALAVRFVAGAFSGLVWGMLAGYARRVAAPEHAGRAVAIAMAGTPVALSVGTPLGAWLGSAVGWRWSFAAVSALTVVVVLLVLAHVPDAPGQRAGSRLPLGRVLVIPGVAVVLGVVFTWMLAHNLLYSYIAPYLEGAGVGLRPDLVLLVFGVSALVGIGVTGSLVDRALRGLALASTATFVVAGALLLALPGSPLATVVAVVLWGVAFGGSATQLQTAVGDAAGESVDVANAMLTTAFNLAIFGGGALGALLVDGRGPAALPVAMVGLSAVALLVVALGRTHAFPRR